MCFSPNPPFNKKKDSCWLVTFYQSDGYVRSSHKDLVINENVLLYQKIQLPTLVLLKQISEEKKLTQSTKPKRKDFDWVLHSDWFNRLRC